MIIVDGHLDLAWNALQWNRDLRVDTMVIRTREATTPGKGRAQNTVSLPDMQRGRVALCFATIMARSTGRIRPHTDFDSVEQAYAIAQSHQAYYHALAARGHVRLIRTREEASAHLQTWQRWDAGAEPKAPVPGIMICMESADPILDPGDLSQWWSQGLRMIGPAHQGPGRYVGGTGVTEGFNADGLVLLRTMETSSMILDMTHLTDTAFWQALEHFAGPIVASHANSRTLVPHQRQFSDEQIRAIQQRDGVIGIGIDNWMLVPGYIKDTEGNPRVTLEHVVNHIDYLCQLTGSTRHCAIGSDLDGGFGREEAPADLDTIADLQKLAGLLAQRGYSAEDVAAILHGNWTRILMTHLPSASATAV